MFGAPVMDKKILVSAHSSAFLVHKMYVKVFWVITPYDLCYISQECTASILRIQFLPHFS